MSRFVSTVSDAPNGSGHPPLNTINITTSNGSSITITGARIELEVTNTPVTRLPPPRREPVRRPVTAQDSEDEDDEDDDEDEQRTTVEWNGRPAPVNTRKPVAPPQAAPAPRLLRPQNPSRVPPSSSNPTSSERPRSNAAPVMPSPAPSSYRTEVVRNTPALRRGSQESSLFHEQRGEPSESQRTGQPPRSNNRRPVSPNPRSTSFQHPPSSTHDSQTITAPTQPVRSTSNPIPIPTHRGASTSAQSHLQSPPPDDRPHLSSSFSSTSLRRLNNPNAIPPIVSTPPAGARKPAFFSEYIGMNMHAMRGDAPVRPPTPPSPFERAETIVEGGTAGFGKSTPDQSITKSGTATPVEHTAKSPTTTVTSISKPKRPSSGSGNLVSTPSDRPRDSESTKSGMFSPSHHREAPAAQVPPSVSARSSALASEPLGSGKTMSVSTKTSAVRKPIEPTQPSRKGSDAGEKRSNMTPSIASSGIERRGSGMGEEHAAQTPMTNTMRMFNAGVTPGPSGLTKLRNILTDSASTTSQSEVPSAWRDKPLPPSHIGSSTATSTPHTATGAREVLIEDRTSIAQKSRGPSAGTPSQSGGFNERSEVQNPPSVVYAPTGGDRTPIQAQVPAYAPSSIHSPPTAPTSVKQPTPAASRAPSRAPPSEKASTVQEQSSSSKSSERKSNDAKSSRTRSSDSDKISPVPSVLPPLPPSSVAPSSVARSSSQRPVQSPMETPSKPPKSSSNAHSNLPSPRETPPRPDPVSPPAEEQIDDGGFNSLGLFGVGPVPPPIKGEKPKIHYDENGSIAPSTPPDTPRMMAMQSIPC